MAPEFAGGANGAAAFILPSTPMTASPGTATKRRARAEQHEQGEHDEAGVAATPTVPTRLFADAGGLPLQWRRTHRIGLHFLYFLVMPRLHARLRRWLHVLGHICKMRLRMGIS